MEFCRFGITNTQKKKTHDMNKYQKQQNTKIIKMMFHTEQGNERVAIGSVFIPYYVCMCVAVILGNTQPVHGLHIKSSIFSVARNRIQVFR